MAVDTSSQYTVNIDPENAVLEVFMKLYAAMFIATLSMPIASLTGIFAIELEYVWSIRQAIGVGVLVGSVILIAVITFLSSIPSTLQRLRSQVRTSN